MSYSLSMAYGQALKDRVLRLYDEGQETKSIADRLRVSPSWCRRVRQRRHERPRKIGGGHFKLDDAGRSVLAGWVKERPDATLEELRQRCLDEQEIRISIGALWNTLRRMKLSLKKSP
ncbi:MAG: helix-turn-helix domain-containing protein [Tepidisphaeraceae bacterium]